MKPQKPQTQKPKIEEESDETDDETVSSSETKDVSKDKWVILLNKYIGN
jgi:hypothetical protein